MRPHTAILCAGIAISASGVAAQNQYFYTDEFPDETYVYMDMAYELSSCSLPKDTTYVVLTGMRNSDTYFARSGPASTFNYTSAIYPFESYLPVEKPYLQTLDAEAAAICEHIDSGDRSDETLMRFHQKITEDAYWWEVTPWTEAWWGKYSPRAGEVHLIGGEEADPVVRYGIPNEQREFPRHEGSVFLSARMMTYATPREFRDAWQRINGLGEVYEFQRGYTATIQEMEGIGSDHATMLAVTNNRDKWRTCAFFQHYMGPSLDGRDFYQIANGVSPVCRNVFEEIDSIEDFYTNESFRSKSLSANCTAGTIDFGHMVQDVFENGKDDELGLMEDMAIFELLCPEQADEKITKMCADGYDMACIIIDE